MESSSSSGAVTRRRFLEVAAAAGVSAALVSPVMALAQGASGGAAKKSTGAGKAAPPPAAKPDEKPSEFAPDAQAMTAVIRRRYGQHLDDAQMKEVTDELDQRMQLGKALRAVKLDNGTEPEVTFRA